MESKKYYRYYSNSDGSYVYVQEYIVAKHTPKGVWIYLVGSHFPQCKKFILTDARKHFACPTIEEARLSFIARQERRIKLLTEQLLRTNKALKLITTTKSTIKYEYYFPNNMLDFYTEFGESRNALE